MPFKALSLPLIVLSCLLASCSGNESSVITNPDTTLNIVLGIVQSGLAENIEVQGVAVSVSGKLALDDETGQLTGVSAITDSRGRFALGLNSENESAVIMFARGSETDETKAISDIQCKLPQGCNVKQGDDDALSLIAFGGFYNPKYYYDYVVNDEKDTDPETNDEYKAYDTTLWSAGLEFTALGQFISINSITDMAGAFGFSTYINDGTGVCDKTGCSSANEQAPGFFSKYGIVKANTQLGNLLDLTDIVSKEPANIAALDSLSASSSAALIQSIRYGALIAALQQIQLEYDNALAMKTDRRFRREINLQFSQNKGQLYQNSAPAGQVLTLENWITTARDILTAANTHFNSLGKQLPIEVGSVISDFEVKLAAIVDGQLTQAQPSIPKSLNDSYDNEIKYTKAMLSHLTKVADEFSNPEYRNKAKAYQQQIEGMGDDISPAFNAVTSSMLDLYGYYLSCNYSACDPVNEWHSKFSSFDVDSKVLMLKYSEDEGDQLKVSQRIIDLITDDDITNPTESLSIDFIVEGVIKTDKLTVITDFSEAKVGEASMRVSYNINASQLYPDDSLRSLNPSMPAQVTAEPVYPVAYEFAFTTLELQYIPDAVTVQQNLKGAFSWVLRGVRDVRDLSLPWRYNLNNFVVVMNLEGLGYDIGNDEKISDNVVMSLSGTGFNTSNYYPDTVFPEITNYFVARAGMEVGASSGIPILESSIINYDFPKVDENGVPVEGSILEGKVQLGKNEKVKILKFDYLHAGAAAFVVYPVRDDGKFLGMVCSVPTQDEEYFIGKAEGEAISEDEIIGNITRPNDGSDPTNIFTCYSQALYDGPATIDNFMNLVWDVNSDFVKAISVQGEGVYFADLNTLNNGDDLAPFNSAVTQYAGTMFAPSMLGIDTIRLQLRPQLNNLDNTKKLAEVALDLNLIRPTTSSINVGLFVAYNPEQVLNTEAGLPYLAAGENTESYYIAYRTTDLGDETGAFIFNWQGAQLVDGGSGVNVLQDYDASNAALSEDFLFNLGSDVFYGDTELNAGHTRCGLLFPGENSDKECDAIAYLTFRGFVTGTVREERPGVYVARFIDGSWQVIGN